MKEKDHCTRNNHEVKEAADRKPIKNVTSYID